MRDAWFAMLCDETLGALPPERRSMFTDPSIELGPSELVSALTVLRVAEMCLVVRSATSIAETLTRSGLVRSNDGSGLADVVRSIRDHVFGAVFPQHSWWDVRALSAVLLGRWTALRVESVGAEQARVELRTIWSVGVDHPALVDILLDLPADPFAEWPRNSPDIDGLTADGELAALLTHDEMIAASEEWLGRCDPALRAAPHLQQLLRYAIAVANVRDASTNSGLAYGAQRSTAAVRAAGSRWAGAYRRAVRRVLDGLPAAEVALLERLDDDGRFRIGCLNSARLLLGARSWERRGTDVPEPWPVGCVEAPRWMRNEVFGHGARAWHGTLGPIPWWFCVMEGATEVNTAVEMFLRGAVGLSWRDVSRGEIDLVIPEPQEGIDDLRVPMFYPPQYVNTSWELLVIAEVGIIRLDVLALDGSELICLGACALTLPEDVRSTMRELATRALRRHLDDNPETLYGMLLAEHDETGHIAFKALDNAKAEDLHEDLLLLSATDLESAELLASRRAAARRAAERIEALLNRPGQDDSALFVLQAEEHARLAARVHGRVSGRLGGNPDHGLRRRLAVLAGDDRCFVHFSTQHGEMAAYWARTDGRSVATGTIEFHPRAIVQLAEAADLWLQRDLLAQVTGDPVPDILTTLASGLACIAEPIAAEFADSGVRHLVLSPTWLLDLLPVHAFSVGKGSEAPILLDLFDSITYAPSVHVLHALSTASRSVGKAVLSVAVQGPEPLQGIAAEPWILDQLYHDHKHLDDVTGTPRAVLSSATKADIINIACHGKACTYHLESRLDLVGEGLGNAALTTARILADGDFSAARLVVLNGCGTGVHPTMQRGVENPRGIDAAFLARGARCVASSLWEISDVPSMAYSAVFHAGVANGDVPLIAHQRALTYLRAAQWRTPTGDPTVQQAEGLLEERLPGWSNLISRQTASLDFSHPYFWAAFKLTGLAW